MNSLSYAAKQKQCMRNMYTIFFLVDVPLVNLSFGMFNRNPVILWSRGRKICHVQQKKVICICMYTGNIIQPKKYIEK